MNDEVLIAQSATEAEVKSDYETERGKPMPNLLHGTLQSELIFQLRLKYDNQYDFPTEVTLDISPAAAPDISIYPKRASFDPLEMPAKEPEMPITTIEIISPSQSFSEMAKKIRKSYFPHGVKSAWIVVPEIKGIHILLPDDNNLYFNSGTLTDPATGIELSIEKVFERII